jgi:hypothetical protein
MIIEDPDSEAWKTCEWEGDEGIFRVSIDRTGHVGSKDFTEKLRVDVGVVELLQWRFERWWNRVFGSTR